MVDALEMIVAGRVMLLLSELGVRDARCLSIYRDAVFAAVRQHATRHPSAPLSVIEPFLGEQLELLEEALRGRALLSTAAVCEEDHGAQGAEPDPVTASAARDDGTGPGSQAGQPATPSDPPAEAPGVESVPAEEERQRSARNAKAASGYVPDVKSMEEKLQDERVPVKKLLLEDCVAAGLVDVATAQQLVLGMTGKTSQVAEREIVEQLRQVLQQQVKHFIRKAKGGPWADPRAQEDLRKDIHAANSVRSVLLLSRQVVKEHQQWEQEKGRPGILGLFSARRRLARP